MMSSPANPPSALLLIARCVRFSTTLLWSAVLLMSCGPESQALAQATSVSNAATDSGAGTAGSGSERDGTDVAQPSDTAAGDAPADSITAATSEPAGAAAEPAGAAADSPDSRGATSGASGGRQIEFERHVAPILQHACLRCHGGDKDAIDDLLTSAARARQGGDSGRDLLSLPIESNELIRRVRSETLGDRMPLGNQQLSPGEIDTLVQWIQQGARWPEAKGAPPRRPWHEEIAFQALDKYEQLQGDRFKPCAYAFLGVLLLLLVRQRVREAVKAGRTPSGLWKQLGDLSGATFTAATLAIGLWVAWLQISRLSADVKKLKAENLSLSSPTNSLYSVTRTIKPQHPRRLHGEYYRGNDERNEALFNGGFYRTCTFRVELRDAADRRIEYGAPWPASCHLHFEVIQSPFAAATLFLPENMTRVLLWDVPPLTSLVKQDDRMVRLKTVADREGAWEADFSIDMSARSLDGKHVRGQVFVYPREPMPSVTGTDQAHYSLSYDLLEVDGKIALESEVWMESMLNVGSIQFTEKGRITPAEWFSATPIPEIVGGNTSDPNLLGITPHQKWLNLPPSALTPPPPATGTSPPPDAPLRGEPPLVPPPPPGAVAPETN